MGRPAQEGQHGFWWVCKRPRAIYQFGPDVLLDVARRVLEWIRPGRVVLVPDYVTSWRRLVIQKENSGDPFREHIRQALREHRAASGGWFRRASYSLKEKLSLDRDPSLLGALVLDGWTVDDLAGLANACAWADLVGEHDAHSFDFYLIPVGRPRLLRFQHEGTLWCYAEDERDIETFSGICTEIRFDGDEIPDEHVDTKRLQGPDGRFYAWMSMGRELVVHKHYLDIGSESSKDDANREVLLQAQHAEDAVALEVGTEGDEEGMARITLSPQETKRVASALRSAVRAVREEAPMKRVVVESGDPMAQAAAIVWVARGRAYLTIRSLTRRYAIRSEPDRTEELASALEELASENDSE